MWENKESFHGLSVLPYFGGTYKDAPFQECDEKEFLRRLKLMEEVDLTKIKEDVDNTDLTGELACAGGACDLEY
jgi:ribonucleoside-diphosphate reductase alpha chain